MRGIWLFGVILLFLAVVQSRRIHVRSDPSDPNYWPASLVKDGWLSIHTCQRQEEPAIRGENIIAAVQNGELDPVTAADDPFTSLTAVFVRGFDEQLWARWQVTTREGWGDWTSFSSPRGLGLRDLPKAITNGNSHITVIVIANDGQVYSIQQLSDSTSFSNWTLVGGTLPSDLASNSRDITLVKANDGRIFAYIIVNGIVYESHETSSNTLQWTNWAQVMGSTPIKGRVAVALNTFTKKLEAFSVHNDGCIYQAWQHNDESWTGWADLWECWSQPMRADSNIAVHQMSWSVFNGNLEIFFRATDNRIWHTWQTTCVPYENPWSYCTWGAYYSEGDSVPARQDSFVDLEVASNIHGGLEVFVTGSSGELFHMWQAEMQGSWSNWESVGSPESGSLSSQPRVIHDKAGWWNAFVRGQNGDIEIYVQQRKFKVFPRSVPYGSTIIISWEVPKDEACNDDWLAVYEPQATNDNYLAFVYVNGRENPGDDPIPTGRVDLPLYLPEGYYEVRYNVKRQPKDVMRVLFKISSSSDLSPQEQLFNGIAIGLGYKGWNFENCTGDLNATFYKFEEAFKHFENQEIYDGLQDLGQGILDFSASMRTCSEGAVWKSIENFAKDLIACTVGFCGQFVISIAREIIIIYLRIHEIYRGIEAADNNFQIQAYEQAGVYIGDVIRACIQISPGDIPQNIAVGFGKQIANI